MPQTVHIEKLVFGGDGLARTPDGTVFVTDVCAGEQVEIEILGVKAQTRFARPSAIITPSPHRRPPPCPYTGLCGGCNWQHIKYEEQLQSKKEIFNDCFTRIGKLKDLPPVEMIAGPEWKCRLRTQLKIDWNSRSIGFFKRKSDEIAHVKHCMMLVDMLDDILKRQDMVLPAINQGVLQIKALAGSDMIASYPVVPGFTSAETMITVAGKTFSAGGDSFFQSNAFLPGRLASWVGDCLEGGCVADLFGGLGFFSILTAHRFEQGILVDNDRILTGRATGNFRRNGITNVAVKTCSAEDFFLDHSLRPGYFDSVILDPPRPGLTKIVLDGLKKNQPRQIIYVSCNPSTQARDAGFLVRDCGYTIEKAAIFDLYPQTHHMETALLLSRSQKH